MVCQTLVTAITPAPLTGGFSPLQLSNVTCRATTSSVSAPQPQPSNPVSWRGDFIHVPRLADVSDCVRCKSVEWLFKWTRGSKAVVAGARTWHDWLRRSASCSWNQNRFPNSGKRGRYANDFNAKWTAVKIWSEACLCCYFIYVIYICEDLGCSMNISAQLVNQYHLVIEIKKKKPVDVANSGVERRSNRFQEFSGKRRKKMKDFTKPVNTKIICK